MKTFETARIQSKCIYRNIKDIDLSQFDDVKSDMLSQFDNKLNYNIGITTFQKVIMIWKHLLI